ncbi:integrase catalytic domain-containing protein [Trichonephila clavipes]|nr:integrase catalytic domain-containing protein [Trichonephila clavipes]
MACLRLPQAVVGSGGIGVAGLGMSSSYESAGDGGAGSISMSLMLSVSVSAKHIYAKREVLSVIAKLYDPLGFLGSVIAKAKVFLQQLWQCKLDWDDVLPNSIANEWRELVTTLKCMEEVQINRFIMADNNIRIVLQGFVDASEAVYGAAFTYSVFFTTVLPNDGLLRVGGRLSNSDLPYVNKHPAILPGNHNLTVQIIAHFHRKNLHTGSSSLLYVREKFWPLNGRSLCRKVVHECLVCFKSRPLVTSQLMGNLSRDRVVPDYPFNCSGVDFCGPFMTRYKNQRKGILHKIYICVFVCFVSKAIHIEIVSDLTSDAFIATLKRFFSRRGKCAKLYSDNGKAFVIANKELKRFLKLIEDSDDNLAGFLSAEGMEWKFIPSRAPSFGGLWEASVKSIKCHLKRVVSGSNLTYEEFLTVCIQIEGILNSRPLCPLSSNSDNLNALTPTHFLIGRSMTSVVEPNLIQLKDNALKNGNG